MDLTPPPPCHTPGSDSWAVLSLACSLLNPWPNSRRRIGRPLEGIESMKRPMVDKPKPSKFCCQIRLSPTFPKQNLQQKKWENACKLTVWRTHLNLITFEFIFYEKPFLQQKHQFLFPVFLNVLMWVSCGIVNNGELLKRAALVHKNGIATFITHNFHRQKQPFRKLPAMHPNKQMLNSASQSDLVSELSNLSMVMVP